MRRAPLTIALTTLLAAVGSLPAGAANPTSVDSISATLSGSSVAITGAATLGGQDPVTLGEDATGDALGGPAATAAGLDVTKLIISRPTPTSPNLNFVIKLGGLATGGIPETIMYNWDINVNGGAADGGSSWSIKTMRTRASNTTNTEPYAGVFTCVPGTTGFSCSQQSSLSGVVFDQASGEIRLPVPLSAIGAQSGSLIEAWPRATNPFWIGPSASGAQTLTNIFDTATHDPYVVPGVTVQLGIAPAGQPVSFNQPGTINSSGAFSGTVPAPATAGSYTVGAKVCFGTNCATRETPLTV